MRLKKLHLTNEIEERHHICAMHAHTWGWKWELNHNNKWQLVQTRRCFCPYPLITMLILCHHRHNIVVGGRCQPQNTSICFCPYPLITILVFLSTEAQQSHLKTPFQNKSVTADYDTRLYTLVFTCIHLYTLVYTCIHLYTIHNTWRSCSYYSLAGILIH